MSEGVYAFIVCGAVTVVIGHLLYAFATWNRGIASVERYTHYDPYVSEDGTDLNAIKLMLERKERDRKAKAAKKEQSNRVIHGMANVLAETIVPMLIQGIRTSNTDGQNRVNHPPNHQVNHPPNHQVNHPCDR
jgi:hypothetical protein